MIKECLILTCLIILLWLLYSYTFDDENYEYLKGAS